MGKGRPFSVIEEDIIIENFEDTTMHELEKLLAANGYVRTRKSLKRKIEKLQEAGKIGKKSRSAVLRSLKQGHRIKKNKVKEEASEAKVSSDDPVSFKQPSDDGWDGDEDWGGDDGWS